MKDNKFVYYISIFLLIIFPFHRILTYTINALGVTNSFLFDINKVIYLWITLPILIYIYIKGLFKNEYKLNKYDYICYFLLLMGLITSLFAVDKYTSIFGKIYRDEGLLSIYTYIFIFLNAKNIKNKKYIENIINIFLVISLIQVIYAIVQVYTNLSFIRHYSTHYMASGLSGNPNFFGSYMVLSIAISSILYLSRKKIRYLLLSVMYLGGIILASSTGPFITVIILFILLIYYLIRKEFNIKNYLILLISLVIGYFLYTNLITLTNKEETIKDNYNISKEIETVINSDNKDTSHDVSNGRITLWKNSLPLTKKYIIVGAGFDNFINVYEHNTPDLAYDKAHNIYLEMFICSGGLYLVGYLLLCFFIIKDNIKKKDSLLLALFMAFLAYSIQGFSNINVIDICFIFWMFTGFINRLGEDS